MKAWWKQPYINRLQWILEHYEWFGFSETEGLVVLMIEYVSDTDYSGVIGKENGTDEGSAGSGAECLMREEVSGIESWTVFGQFQLRRTL